MFDNKNKSKNKWSIRFAVKIFYKSSLLLKRKIKTYKILCTSLLIITNWMIY